MKDQHFDVLIKKAFEDLSPRTRLIVTRRALRHVADRYAEERLVIRMAIRRLKRRLPFSKAKLKEAENLLGECRKHNRALLVDLGRFLRDHHQLFESAMSFDELCEVLCVNPVHRQEAGKHERGLFGITWIGGQFEDSSTNYGKWGAYGEGPITRAIDAALTDWMINNMDKLPDPYAPDGPFYGVPTYTKMPDGTMLRNAPTVTVHDSQGSRVITGKPRAAK